MAEYILVRRTSDKRWLRAPESRLPDEGALQEIVKAHPETLPLTDLGEHVPPVLTVGRESMLGNGIADVIGIDQDGLITVIECKLDRNPEVKRTVVGQILGYGAYLWRLSYSDFEARVVRPYFDNADRCHRPDLVGVSLAEAMARFLDEAGVDEEFDAAAFRGRLEENLMQGRLRLVIVVDKVNDELRRIVEYLNDCTQPVFQIACAELKYYTTDSAELLVPTLIGKPKAPPETHDGGRRTWDEKTFLAELQHRSGDEAVRVFQSLAAWARKTFDWTWWGTGRLEPSFLAGMSMPGDRVATAFAVYPGNSLQVGFRYLMFHPPYDSEAERMQLLEQLNQVPGIYFPPDSAGGKPAIRLDVLDSPETMSGFIRIMEGVAETLRRTRERSAADVVSATESDDG